MNSEPVVRVKTESFEHFLDPFLSENRNNSAFADLSNRRINECLDCNDEVDYECPSCICQVCLYQTSAEKRYRCFICHKVFHESCRNNPELASSTGRWLCFECKNREKLYSSSFRPHAQPVLAKEDKRNTPLAVVKTEKLDWNNCESEKMDCSANKTCNNGKVIETKPDENTSLDTKDIIIDKVARGFFTKINNARRKKICKSVPSNHFGPIPGIPVGTCWKYRLQVSESGIHRPVVAGISGREVDGAYSIVLSGAYSEDPDFGEEFFYSGCGGRDKYPHKRMAAQTLDQSLTRYNKALALSCNAPFNDLVGAEAVDWRAGKPVRVIRNYKLRKFSVYAPIEGNRYDGIYKVVKYFPVINHVGLLVWKYLLRRDDPEPAPWTDEGKRIIEEKNLRVIWPCDSDSENEDTKPIVDKIERPLKRVAYNFGNSNQLPKMKACNRPYLKPQMNPTSQANRLPCKQAYNGTYIKTEPNQFPNPGQLYNNATPGTYAKPGTSQFANTGRLYNRAAYNGTYIKSEVNQFNPVSQFPSIAPYNGAYLKPGINQRANVNRLPSMEAYNGTYLKSQVNQFSDASRLPMNAYNGTYIKSEVIHLPDVDPLNTCTGPPKPEMNQFANRLPAYNGTYIKSEISQWSHTSSLDPYDGTYIKSEPQEFTGINRLPTLEPYDGTYFKSGVNQLANANRFPNWEAYIRTLWNSDISQLPPILNPAPNPAPIYGGQQDIKPDVNLLQANLFKQQPSYSYNYNWHREICTPISAPIEPAAPFSCSLASARSQEPPGGATSYDAEYRPPADADSAVLPSVPSTLDSAKNNNDHDYANMNCPTNDDCEPSNNSSAAGSISVKQEAHELPASVEKLIDMDTSNETVWAYCKTYLKKSEREFSDLVKLVFTCRYCWKLVNRPITTPCDHNVCLECINNHFSKKLFSCPHCHESLGPTFEIVENKNLACALENLFPGYNLKLPTFS